MPSRQFWRRLAWLAALLAAAVGAALLWQRLRPPPPPAGFVSANGRLEATEVDVATKAAGRLVLLLAREGDAVRRGDVVGRMDMAETAALRAQAEAQRLQARQSTFEAQAGVARAESDLALARANLARTRELVARHFVSPAQLDRDEAGWASAQAALRAARMRVEAARAAEAAAEASLRRFDVLLADGELLAPIEGRVLYRLVEPGAVMAAGGKVLTVIDLSDVFMTVFLPAADAGRLTLGAPARIALDAWPGETVPARVEFVADEAQFTPREVETRSERDKLMFRVKLRVDAAWLAGHGAHVKPGMPGVAWVRLDPARPWPAGLPAR